MKVYKIKTSASYLLIFVDAADKRLYYVNDSEDFRRYNGKYISEIERADIEDIPAAAEFLDARDYQNDKQIATLSEAWKQLKDEIIFGKDCETLGSWNIDL